MAVMGGGGHYLDIGVAVMGALPGHWCGSDGGHYLGIGVAVMGALPGHWCGSDGGITWTLVWQ